MYNSYGVQRKKQSNQPSLTLKEWCEDNDYNPKVVQGLLVHDDSIVAAFNRKRTDFYHLSDLSLWESRNIDKLIKAKK